MNFFECLSKGYVPPANYFKSDLLNLLNINTQIWLSLYNNAKRVKNNRSIMLHEELKESGYKKKQRQVTKLQCRIIFEYIGYPDLNETNKAFLISRKFISEKDIEQADQFAK